MGDSTVQAVDILPGPMIDGTFCETDDQLFAALSSPLPGAEVKGSTLRVYDLIGLKGVADPIEIGDQSFPKLPLRWEAEAPDLYQSVYYTNGRLLVAGLQSLMQLDAEGGAVKSLFDDRLDWPEEVTFPEPIFPPFVHNGHVIVLSHNGSIYKFPRRTPPSGELRPIYAVGGWKLPEPEPEPEEPPHAYPATKRHPGVYVQEPPPPLTPEQQFISVGSVRQPGTLIGDRLMFQHDNHIVVFDVEAERLVSTSSFEQVTCNGVTFNFWDSPIGAALRPDQKIVDLNGYGFLPFETPQHWRLDSDEVLSKLLAPLMMDNDHRNEPGYSWDILFHLISGILIAPDGTLTLPISIPAASEVPWIYSVLLRSTPTKKERYGGERGDAREPTVEPLRLDGTYGSAFLFKRFKPDVFDQGLGGMPQGRGMIYRGPYEEEVLWAYLSTDENGGLHFANSSAGLDEALHTSPPFWMHDPMSANFEKAQIVAKADTLTAEATTACATPGVTEYTQFEDATAVLVRGETGRTMAFTDSRSFDFESPWSCNKLILLPN